MDPAAAMKAAKAAWKGYRQVMKWIAIDQNRRVRVKRDFIAGRFVSPLTLWPTGRKVDCVPDFECPDFGIRAGVMTIYATGDREPFCDGATYAPDRIGKISLIAGALAHDAGYQHLEAIAKAWGWTEDEVRWLFDCALGNTVEVKARRQKSAVWRAAGATISRMVFAAVRAFGGLYHKSRRN